MRRNTLLSYYKISLLVLAYVLGAKTAMADELSSLANTCNACHSASMVSTVKTFPILHGQKSGYLAAQIMAFRDGVRVNPQMQGVVDNLSDEQIQKLADYYAQQTIAREPIKEDSRSGVDVRARCVSCHGLSGHSVNTEWPNLQGQNSAYLYKQLADFAMGARESMIMNVIASELSDQQMKDVSDYYENQGRTH